MADNFDNIKGIMDSVLGEPKHEYGGNGGWYEYNCPCCAENNGRPDNKYNFAVQIDEQGLWAHCWKCGFHGKLSKVVKRWGSQSDFEEYRNELSALKESRFFSFSDGSNAILDDLFDNTCLELPEGFKIVDAEDKSCKDAYAYLIGRGVDDRIIKEFHIGYVGAYSGKYSNRVVIPSYDMFGDLNYWVARDYTGKSYRKILNPDVDKKNITFNEAKINWYEPVTLVEGPFDHIVVPNSIPLLGKSIDNDTDVYKKLTERLHNYVNILLDDDATDTAYDMYKFLNTAMPGNVRIIECPDGYDASEYYEEYGQKGIASLLRSAHKLSDFELSMV